MTNFNFKNFMKDWVFPIGGAVAVALLIQKLLIFQVYVPSESMAPTIEIGDRMLALRLHSTENLKTGDILIFNVKPGDKEMLFIKRLIGPPGSTVEIIDGKVSVDGKLIDEPYVKNPDHFTGTFKVPNGKYFFMGDNRNHSTDLESDVIGLIDESKLVGKAGFKFWPLYQIKFIK